MRSKRFLLTLLMCGLALSQAWGATAPVAGFTWSPASPAVLQVAQFTDASTGTPKSWAWAFGDGATSTVRNPTHVYGAAGTYDVTLTVKNAAGKSSLSRKLMVSAGGGGPVAFNGNIVLGSPTGTSVKANIYSPDQSGYVSIGYGTTSGSSERMVSANITAGTPLELTLGGLGPDTIYYYRLSFTATRASSASTGSDYTFRTARTAGNTFTFAVQGDSHPERAGKQFDANLYVRTLQTAAADKPDFYVMMGDDFSVDTLDPATINESQVRARYALQRPWLGLIGRTAPVFLVNGNHEQAARYLLNGTANNVAVWAANARNAFYSEPAPDGFYTGTREALSPFITGGSVRNYYAWTWGDALFVVIDPYWESTVPVDGPFGGGSKTTNLWLLTHGYEQYQWLAQTFATSTAKYKFVFAHHVLGTGRGGIDVAGKYEWGGYNSNGTTWGFTTNRPGWTNGPIHQLMAANHVTIFFQGHDHIWVRQQLDGVIYQALSEPADPYYALYNADAYATGNKYPNTGYTRVTVSPTGVKVDYVRTYLPSDEGPGKLNGTTAFSYTIP